MRFISAFGLALAAGFVMASVSSTVAQVAVPTYYPVDGGGVNAALTIVNEDPNLGLVQSYHSFMYCSRGSTDDDSCSDSVAEALEWYSIQICGCAADEGETCHEDFESTQGTVDMIGKKAGTTKLEWCVYFEDGVITTNCETPDGAKIDEMLVGTVDPIYSHDIEGWYSGSMSLYEADEE